MSFSLILKWILSCRVVDCSHYSHATTSALGTSWLAARPCNSYVYSLQAFCFSSPSRGLAISRTIKTIDQGGSPLYLANKLGMASMKGFYHLLLVGYQEKIDWAYIILRPLGYTTIGTGIFVEFDFRHSIIQSNTISLLRLCLLLFLSIF